MVPIDDKIGMQLVLMVSIRQTGIAAHISLHEQDPNLL